MTRRKSAIFEYPKADTPGCTKEACSFRDSIESFNELELDVYGISTDSVKDQKNFAERTTFLVRNGQIQEIFRKVDPEEHVEEILSVLN
ncbi:MAG: peroxiredoxin [Candidatus Nanosalina sp.]